MGIIASYTGLKKKKYKFLPSVMAKKFDLGMGDIRDTKTNEWFRVNANGVIILIKETMKFDPVKSIK